jgi:protochlorophyllide reductase
LLAADHARVVTVSSIAHRKGAIRLDDLNWEFEYSPSHAYGQSKLANVLFFTELDRRIRAKGLPVVSTGAHPGLTATNLGRSGPRLSASPRRAIRAVVVGTCTSVGLRIVGQSIEHGALPQLYAATAPDVVGGQYFGPDGPGEIRGGPTLRSISAAGANIEMARRLFERSEELTGVTYSELSSSK